MTTPAMFYVIVFDHQEQDYVPVAVFHKRSHADDYLEEVKKTVNMVSGAVVEMTWASFMSFATRSRLGKLAEALEKLGIKS